LVVEPFPKTGRPPGKDFLSFLIASLPGSGPVKCPPTKQIR